MSQSSRQREPCLCKDMEDVPKPAVAGRKQEKCQMLHMQTVSFQSLKE